MWYLASVQTWCTSSKDTGMMQLSCLDKLHHDLPKGLAHCAGKARDSCFSGFQIAAINYLLFLR